MAMFDLRGKEL